MTTNSTTPVSVTSFSRRVRSSERVVRHAFTLMEVLVALVLVLVIIPVALRALRVASQVDAAAEEIREAAELGDLKVQELLATGDWQDGDESGDFGDDHPGYRWELATDDWTVQDVTMTRLDLTVYARSGRGETPVLVSTIAQESTTNE